MCFFLNPNLKTTMKKTILLTLFLSFFCLYINAQSAEVTKTWIEHGVTENGLKGMRVHTDFVCHNARSCFRKDLCVYLLDDEKNWLYTTYPGYYNSALYCFERRIAFDPIYPDSYFNDFKVFIPYNAISFYRGQNTYYCHVSVDLGSNYYSGEYVSFSGTGGANAQPKPQKSNQNYTPNNNSGNNNYNSNSNRNNTQQHKRARHQCRRCNGSGNCSTCNGSGKVLQGIGRKYQTSCSSCYGRGRCASCGGSGYHETSGY